jgi:hypothetical protein
VWKTAEEIDHDTTVPSAEIVDTSIGRENIHDPDYFSRTDNIDVTEVNPVLTGEDVQEDVQENDDGMEWVDEPDEEGEYIVDSSWTIPELKEEIIRRGLKPGRRNKAGLIELLS